MLYIQYPSWIKPEIFSSLPIRWYGLMYVFGFLTCYFFILSQIKKEKNKSLEEQLPNIFMWAFIGMLLGARLASELIYNRNMSILIQPWNLVWPFRNGQFTGLQGMSYHGGVFGIIVAIFTYCKLYKIDFKRFADKMVIGAAFGYTFGRIGNFTNAELYGRITTSPWGMIFPYAESLPIADQRVEEVANAVGLEPNALGLINLPRHPSQLYESFLEGLLLGIVLLLLYKLLSPTKKYVPGMFVGLYIIGYGLARFFVEYFRQPDKGLDFVLSFSSKPNPEWVFVSPFNFTTGQVLSSIMILLGGAFLVFLYIQKKIEQKKTLVAVK